MRPHAGASMVTTRRRPWCGALVVEGGDPDPQAGKKGEMLHGDSVPMRVFSSAWPGLQIRFESSASHGYWDCLTLLPHRVTSGMYNDESGWMMKDNFFFYHVCYWIDAN